MDLVGKLYKDFIVDSKLLDGNSYSINEFCYGGVLNLFKDNKFLNSSTNDLILNCILITNKGRKVEFDKHEKIKFQEIFVEQELPTAFIIESDEQRSSFVINDNITNIKFFEKKSDSLCLFYGDKIKSQIFNQYKKVYIDTAGNNPKHLFELAKSNQFPDTSVISISKEYLNENILNEFLKNKSFAILSHSPKESIIYSNGKVDVLKNAYYKEPYLVNPEINITGLGDKFFLMVAVYNFYFNYDLQESTIMAQKFISEYISKRKNN